MQTVKTHSLNRGHMHILTSAQAYHHFPKHYHETYSIAMLTSGAKDFKTNTDGGILHQSNIATMNPYEIHYGQSIVKDGWQQLVILFDSEAGGQFAEENELRRKTLEFTRAVKDDASFRRVVVNLCNSIVSTDSDMEKDNLYEMLMGSIFSAEKLISISSPYINKRGIGRTVALMTDDPGKKHTLEELAETAGMSKFHYLRSFKQETGMTPHAYLNITRVEKARRTLLTTGKSIAETATECGFADQAHLTRAYKKIYGAAPGSIIRK